MKTQKIKKYSKLVLVFLLLIFLSSCFRGRSGGEKIQNKISEKLDLNTEQQTALQSAITKYKDLFNKSKNMADEMKADLLAAVQKEAFDEKSIATNLQNQINKLNAMIPDYIRIFSDFHAQLTQEQKKTLADLMKRYDEQRKQYYKKHPRKKNHHYDRDRRDKDKDKNKY